MIVTLSAADVTEKAAIALNSGSPWNTAGPQGLLLRQMSFLTFPALRLCKYMTLFLKIVIKSAAV